MAKMRDQILDAAEARIRAVGFHGFSFRDLARDVGIKSASVHYHFPTKGDLGARVARRYTERFLASLPTPTEVSDDDALAAYVGAFRGSLIDDGQLCLCGVLSAEAGGLPDEVRLELRRFVDANVDWLTRVLGDPERAWAVFALLEGAMITARGANRPEAFDRATAGLRTEG